jgi:hypothetical protein
VQPSNFPAASTRFLSSSTGGPNRRPDPCELAKSGQLLQVPPISFPASHPPRSRSQIFLLCTSPKPPTQAVAGDRCGGVTAPRATLHPPSPFIDPVPLICFAPNPPHPRLLLPWQISCLMAKSVLRREPRPDSVIQGDAGAELENGVLFGALRLPVPAPGRGHPLRRRPGGLLLARRGVRGGHGPRILRGHQGRHSVALQPGRRRSCGNKGPIHPSLPTAVY